MRDTIPDPTATPVEPADAPIDPPSEQLVALTQALLDGRIDRETYDRLRAQLQPASAGRPISYATPPPGGRDSTARRILVALLAFIAFALLFLAFAQFSFSSRAPQARLAAAKADVATLETALDAFQIDAGRYPTNAEGLSALVTPPPGIPNWHGPYLRNLPTDPWGMAYRYLSPGVVHTMGVDISSSGPDRRAGTPDDIFSP